MKIAFIAPSKVPSNTANSIQVMKVVQAAIQLGHECRLWIPGDRAVDWEPLRQHYGLEVEFPIHTVKARPRLKRYDFSWQTVRLAGQWSADCVYTWMPQAAYFASLRRLPYVFEAHDRPTGVLGPWLLRKISSGRQPKRIGLITNALRKVLEQEFNIVIADSDAVIAPDGVDLERYANLPSPSDARRVLGLPDGKTALYSGHLYAGRGIDLIFELAKSMPDLHFLIVGGNPESVLRWQDKAVTDGIANIHLTGFVPNAQLALYQAAGDYLLMPYENKVSVSSGGNTADICSPMKLFEYLAVGRPILSSELPVLREVLTKQTAIFCDNESVDDWIEALNLLVSNPGLAEKMSAQGLEDARRYDWRTRTSNVLGDWGHRG